MPERAWLCLVLSCCAAAQFTTLGGPSSQRSSGRASPLTRHPFKTSMFLFDVSENVDAVYVVPLLLCTVPDTGWASSYRSSRAAWQAPYPLWQRRCQRQQLQQQTEPSTRSERISSSSR